MVGNYASEYMSMVYVQNPLREVQEYIYNIGVLTVNIVLMWRGLETGGNTNFSESFHPFCAEPHKLYSYRQYTNIVFILQ